IPADAHSSSSSAKLSTGISSGRITRKPSAFANTASSSPMPPPSNSGNSSTPSATAPNQNPKSKMTSNSAQSLHEQQAAGAIAKRQQEILDHAATLYRPFTDREM